MNRTCETCAYFVAKQDPTMGGWCHRYPPTYKTQGVSGTIGAYSALPEVSKYIWCGEWSRKDEESDDE